MRRCIALIVIILAAANVFSQSAAEKTALDKAGLDAATKEKALALYRTHAEDMVLLKADARIKEAELAKLLLSDSVDMAAVRRNLEAIAQVQVSERLLLIQAEIQLRDLVGKDRWAAIRKFIRGRAPASRNSQAPLRSREALSKVWKAIKERKSRS